MKEDEDEDEDEDEEKGEKEGGGGFAQVKKLCWLTSEGTSHPTHLHAHVFLARDHHQGVWLRHDGILVTAHSHIS